MTQQEVITLLNTLSVPSFYDHAPIGTKLPFIAIHSEQPDNFTADNSVYCEKFNFRIDLYSVKRDLTIEAAIKKLLDDNSLPWSMSYQFISSEQCYEVEFDFDVIGG